MHSMELCVALHSILCNKEVMVRVVVVVVVCVCVCLCVCVFVCVFVCLFRSMLCASSLRGIAFDIAFTCEAFGISE